MSRIIYPMFVILLLVGVQRVYWERTYIPPLAICDLEKKLIEKHSVRGVLGFSGCALPCERRNVEGADLAFTQSHIINT